MTTREIIYRTLRTETRCAVFRLLDAVRSTVDGQATPGDILTELAPLVQAGLVDLYDGDTLTYTLADEYAATHPTPPPYTFPEQWEQVQRRLSRVLNAHHSRRPLFRREAIAYAIRALHELEATAMPD